MSNSLKGVNRQPTRLLSSVLFATTFGTFRREFSPLRLCGGNHGGRHAFSGIAQAHSCRKSAVCAQCQSMIPLSIR
jgi:hypothetical protein